MKLHILDIPDDSAELATWLEGHIVGNELRALVAELKVVCDESETIKELGDVLGASADVILRDGLSAAPVDCLQPVLRQPDLLFDLQELVLLDGGDYWDQLIQQRSSPADIESGWNSLRQGLPSVAPKPAATVSSPAPWGEAPTRRSASSGSSRRGIAILIAAALLIAVGFFAFKPPGQQVASGWGFDHPDAIQDDLPAADYLRHLATSAGQWNNKRPETREDVKKRIAQFIAGCDTLITAKHTPLTQDDREWLIERCQAWRDTLTAHVADLDEGATPLDVRAAADATIGKLVKALQTRADEIAT